MEKPYRAHLLNSEYNYHVYVKAPALAYSYHELGAEVSLVGIPAIFQELRLLIQQYFEVVSPLATWILLQCQLCAVLRVIDRKDRSVSQWMIIKMGYNECVNLQLKVPQAVTPAPLNAVVPITFPSWNAMFSCRHTWTRRSTGHNKDIDFRLSNGLVSNNEYAKWRWRWPGDQFHRTRPYVTNSIEPADDVMTVVVVLWVALCSFSSHLFTVLTDT